MGLYCRIQFLFGLLDLEIVYGLRALKSVHWSWISHTQGFPNFKTAALAQQNAAVQN
jgi:hypothetical protein